MKAHEKRGPEQVGDQADDEELEGRLVGRRSVELGICYNQVHTVANSHTKAIAGNKPDPERRIIANQKVAKIIVN